MATMFSTLFLTAIFLLFLQFGPWDPFVQEGLVLMLFIPFPKFPPLFTVPHFLIVQPAAIPQLIQLHLQSMAETEEVAALARFRRLKSWRRRPHLPLLRRAESDPGFPYPDLDDLGIGEGRGGMWRKLRRFIEAAAAFARRMTTRGEVQSHQVAPRGRSTDIALALALGSAVMLITELLGCWFQWSLKVEEDFKAHRRRTSIAIVTATMAAIPWEVMMARTRMRFLAFQFNSEVVSTQHSAASNLWRKARFHAVSTLFSCSWIWALVYTLQVPLSRAQLQIRIMVVLLVKLGKIIADILLEITDPISNRVRRQLDRWT